MKFMHAWMVISDDDKQLWKCPDEQWTWKMRKIIDQPFAIDPEFASQLCKGDGIIFPTAEEANDTKPKYLYFKSLWITETGIEELHEIIAELEVEVIARTISGCDLGIIVKVTTEWQK